MASDISETNELEFSDFWSNNGVNKEVLRGIKLRQEKFKYQYKECAPVDISVDISTNSVKKIPYKNKKFKRGLCQGSILYYQSSLSSTLSTCYKKKRRLKCKPCKGPRFKCPMRIAELAVPTKRQCLDTWRNRGKTLPNFMVDRLRQHVTDQKPMVDIHDAIDCFKSRRIKKLRQNTKKRKTKSDYKNIDRAKLFCALFAHKITMRLLPSGPINTNLRNLSDVINKEIAQLLRNGKTINARNKYMENEISDKVAVWIATILEDSYMKLMLDDLKDLEEKEGHVWDIIDDLVEAVLESCNSKSILNLENQSQKSSKSSSFISIYSNQSSPSSNKAENDEYTETFGTLQDDTEISLQSDETKTEIIELILSDVVNGVGDTQSLKDFIKSVLDDVVPEIIINDSNRDNRTEIRKNSEIHDDFDPKKLSVIIPMNQIQPIANKQVTINYDNDNHNSNRYDKSEVISAGAKDSTQKLNIPERNSNFGIENNSSVTLLNEMKSTFINNNIDHIKMDDINYYKNKKETTFTLEKRSKNIENFENTPGTSIDFEENKIDLVNSLTNDEKGQRNVSKDQTEIHIESVLADAYPINNQTEVESYNYQENAIEESLDDSFKKVKFSDTNIGSDRRITEADNQRSITGNIILDKKLSSSSSRNNFKHINFSPPNSHLLYDVDESWPDDFLPLTNTLSASVSKSVTSLGFIKESDEKVTYSPDVKQDKEISKHRGDNEIAAKLFNSCDKPTKDTKVLHEALLVKIQNLNETKETTVRDNEHLPYNHIVLDKSFRSNRSLKINDHKADLKITKDATTSYINIKLKSKILCCINIDSETLKESNTIEKQTQTENAKQTRIKLQYNPFITRQHEIRIWCKGLRNVVLNLEKWLKWIEYTHILVAQLRNNDLNENILRTRSVPEDYLKQWMKFKKRIDFDAKKWRNLYQCLHVGLKSYTNYHNNNKTIKRRNIVSSQHLQGSCLCHKTF